MTAIEDLLPLKVSRMLKVEGFGDVWFKKRNRRGFSRELDYFLEIKYNILRSGEGFSEVITIWRPQRKILFPVLI